MVTSYRTALTIQIKQWTQQSTHLYYHTSFGSNKLKGIEDINEIIANLQKPSVDTRLRAVHRLGQQVDTPKKYFLLRRLADLNDYLRVRLVAQRYLRELET